MLKQEILREVEDLLSQSKDLKELQVIQQGNTIYISPSNEIVTEHQASEDNTQEVERLKSVNEIEIIEEHVTEDSLETLQYTETETEITQMEEPPLQVEEINHNFDQQDEPSRRSKRKSIRKYKYPINTNDKLNDIEREWIQSQVRSCEVVHEGQVIYKCPLCETFLQISGTLKKHLRDCHVLKSEKDQDVWNSRRAFKDEIKQSKLTVMTSYGRETIWKCLRCESNRIFKSEAGLKVHLRYSHIRNQVISAKFVAQCKIVIDGKDAWKCAECFKILKSRDGLRNHMKLEHPQIIDCGKSNNEDKLYSRSYVDDNCNDSLLNILEGKRRTLKSESTTSSCNECGIYFINGNGRKEKSFRIHSESHNILNVCSLYYQLPKCELYKTMFSNDDDLNTFLQSDQEYFEPIPTDGMIAHVSRKLKEPIGTASGNEADAWRCGHCGVSYQTEVECNTHVMILHSKKLICPIDHMEFEGNRGISQFNIHMRNKHSEMFPGLVISCTYCQAEFTSIFDKLAHMKTCDEKKFECDHCSRKYYTKTELTRHLKIAAGEISYVCDICNKSCSSTMEVKLHRTAHTNHKSYACSYPQCSKAFKTPAARSSHMETHSNTSYSCSFCTSSFRQRALLQRHVRKGFCRRPSKQRVKN